MKLTTEFCTCNGLWFLLPTLVIDPQLDDQYISIAICFLCWQLDIKLLFASKRKEENYIPYLLQENEENF